MVCQSKRWLHSAEKTTCVAQSIAAMWALPAGLCRHLHPTRAFCTNNLSPPRPSSDPCSPNLPHTLPPPRLSVSLPPVPSLYPNPSLSPSLLSLSLFIPPSLYRLPPFSCSPALPSRPLPLPPPSLSHRLPPSALSQCSQTKRDRTSARNQNESDTREGSACEIEGKGARGAETSD